MGNKNKYKSGSIFDMQFITSSISTTLVLLLLGLVVFFVLTAHNLSVYVRENISFSILISDDMKEAASLETFPCLTTHSIFVAGAEYPCDFDHVYSLEEIAQFPLILLERKASSRLFLEKYFLQNGLHLHPEIELGARSLLVDLAAIGFGVAGVTEEFVHRELDSGRLRKLRTSFDIPARSVDLCVLRDVPLTSAAQWFSDVVRGSLHRG